MIKRYREILLMLLTILSQISSGQVNIIKDDFQVSNSLDQLVYRPAISFGESGNFAITWADERSGQHYGGGIGQIFAAIFDRNGNIVTQNFWADDGKYGIGYQQFWIYANSPLLLPNDNLFVVWHISAYGYIGTQDLNYDDIYYSAFSSSGQKIVNGIQLNIQGGKSVGYAKNPNATLIPPSTIFVTYNISLDEVPGIACNLIDVNTGQLLGDAFIINDNGQNARAYPFAASNGTHTVVVWTDARNDELGDIYMQRFTNNNFSGGNVKVNDNNSGYNQFARIAMNSNGDYIVAWLDTRDNAGGDIFIQRYDSSGNSVGANNKITSGNSVFFEHAPAINLLNDNSFIIAWTDSLQGKRYTCKTQMFNSNNEPLTPVTELTASYNTSSSAQVDLKLGDDGTVYYTWLDGRISKGAIYAKILSYGTTGVYDKDLSVKQFQLEQNYPNPFNPSTKISFSLPEKTHVSLKVFDILGKEIADLISEERNAGNYEVDFNTENLANGIYVYQLKAGKNFQSKKMILLK